MAQNPNTPANSLNETLKAAWCTSPSEDPEVASHQRQVCAVLTSGWREIKDSGKIGADTQTNFVDHFPDGSTWAGHETLHPDGSKETSARLLDPVRLGAELGYVDTVIKNGVETAVKVHEEVPGSIPLKEGTTRAAPESSRTEFGLAPTTWNPGHHDDNSGGTTTTPTGSGGPDVHDPGFSTGSFFGSSGNGNTTATGPTTASSSATSSQHACGDNTDCNTGGAWEPGASHQSLTPTEERTNEDDQAELRAFGSASEFDQGSSSASASGPGSSLGGAAAVTGGGAGSITGGDGDKTDDQHKGDDGNSNDGKHDDDNSGDEKPTEATPETDPKEGDMPNPEDSGPGNPNSTPNPEGDGDDGENGHRGPTVTQGSDVGHLSMQLAAGDNSQDGASTDGYHGPHDPGEEMPDPDSNGGGNPISNVAHGATSFWDQAASATQGGAQDATDGATGAQLSTAVAVFAYAGESQLGSSAATTSHDIAGALSDTSEHAAFGAHDFTASGAALHSELGTATLHDTLALSSGSFATQMHL